MTKHTNSAMVPDNQLGCDPIGSTKTLTSPASDGGRVFLTPTMSKVIDAVAKVFDVPRVDILSSSRSMPYTLARQVAMHLLRQKYSTPQIGRAFSRDHTTVLHASAVVNRKMRENPEFAALVKSMQDMDFVPSVSVALKFVLPPPQHPTTTVVRITWPKLPVRPMPKSETSCIEPECWNTRQPGRRRCAECRRKDVKNGRENEH